MLLDFSNSGKLLTCGLLRSHRAKGKHKASAQFTYKAMAFLSGFEHRAEFSDISGTFIESPALNLKAN